jgi:hypothetical protein
MEMPTVSTVLHDTDKNIRYEVLAYRQLGRDELVIAVRNAISMMKKKPKKNSHYQFITIIGFND